MLSFSSTINNIPSKVSKVFQFVSVWELVVIVQFELSKLLLHFAQLLYLVNDLRIVFHLLHVEIEVQFGVVDIDLQI